MHHTVVQSHLHGVVVGPGHGAPTEERGKLGIIVGVLSAGRKIALVGIIEIWDSIVIQVVQPQRIVWACSTKYVESKNNRVRGALRGAAGTTTKCISSARSKGLNLICPELLNVGGQLVGVECKRWSGSSGF